MPGKKTNVLHITGSFASGGLESYLLNLLRLSDRDAFEHFVFVGNDEGPLKSRYHALPVTIVEAKCSPRRYPYCVPFGMSFCRTHRIGVIHGHNYWSYLYAWVLSLATGVPFVTSNYGLGSWKKKRHFRMESLIFRRAGLNMAISRAILDQERSLVAPEARDRFKLIYPIIDEAPIEKVRSYDRDRARKTLGIAGDRPVFTIVGRIDRLKGHRIALDAFERLDAAGVKALLVMVGAMQDPTVLRDTDLRRENVRYLSYYEPIEEVWAASDFFLIPSLSEGTPLVLVEYLALGTPVIASDISGNGELIRNGWNGFLFRTGDAEDLAGKIAAVLARPSLAEVRAHARQFYEDTLVPARLVRDIEQTYLALSR